jgi:6-phosphogluconolactonase
MQNTIPDARHNQGAAMKKGTWARLLPALMLVLAPFMQGCGDFWQAPSSSGGGGTTSTTLSSGVFYVLNQSTRQIVAYQINTGSLSTIGTYSLQAEPYAVTVAPGNGFLYVSTVAGIFLYTIESNGSLVIGNNSGAISTDIAQAMVVDTTGAWLVDAVTGTSGVILNAISITSTGTLNSTTEQSRAFSSANASVQKMVISGDDLNVFVALGAGGTLIDGFTSGNSNPLATTGSTIATVTSGASALSVAVDTGTSPGLFYVGETEASSGSGGLRAFNYSSLGTGTITEIAGSPYASGGLSPSAILPDLSGSYVYVANGEGTTSDGVIQGFNIASDTSSGTTTYTLSALTTVATGILPVGLAEDSDSNFVLAVSSGGSYDLEAYIFDTTTAGKLDDSINSTTGTDPTGAVAVAAQAP